MAKPARPYGSTPVDPRMPPIKAAIDAKREAPQVNKEDPTPEAATVATFHRNADTDATPQALHHTLGAGANQASPGNHRHDGADSLPLFDGTVISTPDGTNTVAVLNQIVLALRALGASSG